MTAPNDPDPRGGSRATWDADATDLPRGAVGGVELCHRCRHYRDTDTVHDDAGTPTCEECDPTLAPPPPQEAATSSRKRPAKKTARARKSPARKAAR